MALTSDDARKIAEYARIAVDEKDLQSVANYLNDMMKTLQPIKEFNLDGVQPTFHPIGDLSNVMREDALAESLPIDKALLNAPQSSERSFKVPTILGGQE